MRHPFELQRSRAASRGSTRPTAAGGRAAEPGIRGTQWRELEERGFAELVHEHEEVVRQSQVDPDTDRARRGTAAAEAALGRLTGGTQTTSDPGTVGVKEQMSTSVVPTLTNVFSSLQLPYLAETVVVPPNLVLPRIPVRARESASGEDGEEGGPTGDGDHRGASSALPARPFTSWATELFRSLCTGDAAREDAALELLTEVLANSPPLSLVSDDRGAVDAFEESLVRINSARPTGEEQSGAALRAQLAIALHRGTLSSLLAAVGSLVAIDSAIDVSALLVPLIQLDCRYREFLDAPLTLDDACAFAFSHGPLQLGSASSDQRHRSDPSPSVDATSLLTGHVATDGVYVYTWDVRGLARIGTGMEGTIRGSTYAFRPGFRTHDLRDADGGDGRCSLFIADGRLFLASPSLARSGALCIEIERSSLAESGERIELPAGHEDDELLAVVSDGSSLCAVFCETYFDCSRVHEACIIDISGTVAREVTRCKLLTGWAAPAPAHPALELHLFEYPRGLSLRSGPSGRGAIIEGIHWDGPSGRSRSSSALKPGQRLLSVNRGVVTHSTVSEIEELMRSPFTETVIDETRSSACGDAETKLRDGGDLGELRTGCLTLVVDMPTADQSARAVGGAGRVGDAHAERSTELPPLLLFTGSSLIAIVDNNDGGAPISRRFDLRDGVARFVGQAALAPLCAEACRSANAHARKEIAERRSAERTRTATRPVSRRGPRGIFSRLSAVETAQSDDGRSRALEMRAKVPTAVCYNSKDRRAWCYHANSSLFQGWNLSASLTEARWRGDEIDHLDEIVRNGVAVHSAQLAGAVLRRMDSMAHRVWTAGQPQPWNNNGGHRIKSGQSTISASPEWRVVHVSGMRSPVYQHTTDGSFRSHAPVSCRVRVLRGTTVRQSPSGEGSRIGKVAADSVYEVVAVCGEWIRITGYRHPDSGESGSGAGTDDQLDGSSRRSLTTGQLDAAAAISILGGAGSDQSISDRYASFVRHIQSQQARSGTSSPAGHSVSSSGDEPMSETWIRQRRPDTGEHNIIVVDDEDVATEARLPPHSPAMHRSGGLGETQRSPGMGRRSPTEAGSTSQSTSWSGTTQVGVTYGAGTVLGASVRWEGKPTDLVGASISVLWAGNRWYNGVVHDYARGKHFVHYEDGDQRWYRMSEKTFRVLSLPDPQQAPEGPDHDRTTSDTGESDSHVTDPSAAQPAHGVAVPLSNLKPVPTFVPFCIDVGNYAREATFSSVTSLLEQVVSRLHGEHATAVEWQLALHLLSVTYVNLQALPDGALREDEASQKISVTHVAESRRFEAGLKALSSGDYPRCIALFRSVLSSRPRLPEAAYNLACCYGLMAKPLSSLRWLARAVRWGYRDADHTETDSDLFSLHGDSRFEALLSCMRGHREDLPHLMGSADEADDNGDDGAGGHHCSSIVDSESDDEGRVEDETLEQATDDESSWAHKLCTALCEFCTASGGDHVRDTASLVRAKAGEALACLLPQLYTSPKLLLNVLSSAVSLSPTLVQLMLDTLEADFDSFAPAFASIVQSSVGAQVLRDACAADSARSTDGVRLMSVSPGLRLVMLLQRCLFLPADCGRARTGEAAVQARRAALAEHCRNLLDQSIALCRRAMEELSTGQLLNVAMSRLRTSVVATALPQLLLELVNRRSDHLRTSDETRTLLCSLTALLDAIMVDVSNAICDDKSSLGRDWRWMPRLERLCAVCINVSARYALGELRWTRQEINCAAFLDIPALAGGPSDGDATPAISCARLVDGDVDTDVVKAVSRKFGRVPPTVGKPYLACAQLAFGAILHLCGAGNALAASDGNVLTVSPRILRPAWKYAKLVGAWALAQARHRRWLDSVVGATFDLVSTGVQGLPEAASAVVASAVAELPGVARRERLASLGASGSAQLRHMVIAIVRARQRAEKQGVAITKTPADEVLCRVRELSRALLRCNPATESVDGSSDGSPTAESVCYSASLLLRSDVDHRDLSVALQARCSRATTAAATLHAIAGLLSTVRMPYARSELLQGLGPALRGEKTIFRHTWNPDVRDSHLVARRLPQHYLHSIGQCVGRRAVLAVRDGFAALAKSLAELISGNGVIDGNPLSIGVWVCQPERDLLADHDVDDEAAAAAALLSAVDAIVLDYQADDAGILASIGILPSLLGLMCPQPGKVGGRVVLVSTAPEYTNQSKGHVRCGQHIMTLEHSVAALRLAAVNAFSTLCSNILRIRVSDKLDALAPLQRLQRHCVVSMLTALVPPIEARIANARTSGTTPNPREAAFVSADEAGDSKFAADDDVTEADSKESPLWDADDVLTTGLRGLEGCGLIDDSASMMGHEGSRDSKVYAVLSTLFVHSASVTWRSLVSRRGVAEYVASSLLALLDDTNAELCTLRCQRLAMRLVATVLPFCEPDARLLGNTADMLLCKAGRYTLGDKSAATQSTGVRKVATDSKIQAAFWGGSHSTQSVHIGNARAGTSQDWLASLSHLDREDVVVASSAAFGAAVAAIEVRAIDGADSVPVGLQWWAYNSFLHPLHANLDISASQFPVPSAPIELVLPPRSRVLMYEVTADEIFNKPEALNTRLRSIAPSVGSPASARGMASLTLDDANARRDRDRVFRAVGVWGMFDYSWHCEAAASVTVAPLGPEPTADADMDDGRDSAEMARAEALGRNDMADDDDSDEAAQALLDPDRTFGASRSDIVELLGSFARQAASRRGSRMRDRRLRRSEGPANSPASPGEGPVSVDAQGPTGSVGADQFIVAVARGPEALLAQTRLATTAISAALGSAELAKAERERIANRVVRTLRAGSEAVALTASRATCATVARSLTAAGFQCSVSENPVGRCVLRNRKSALRHGSRVHSRGGCATEALYLELQFLLTKLLQGGGDSLGKPARWQAAIVDSAKRGWRSLASCFSAPSSGGVRYESRALEHGVGAAEFIVSALRGQPLPVLGTRAAVASAFDLNDATNGLVAHQTVTVSALEPDGTVATVLADPSEEDEEVLGLQKSGGRILEARVAEVRVPWSRVFRTREDRDECMAAVRGVRAEILADAEVLLRELLRISIVTTEGDAQLVSDETDEHGDGGAATMRNLCHLWQMRLIRSLCVDAVTALVSHDPLGAQQLWSLPGLRESLRHMALRAPSGVSRSLLSQRRSVARRWLVDCASTESESDVGAVDSSNSAPRNSDAGETGPVGPDDWDPSCAWHSFAIDVPTPEGQHHAPQRAMQFAGFARREEDPRRAENRHGRRTDAIVFPSDAPIPVEQKAFYFEVHIENAERSSRDRPSVCVGLWPDTVMTRGEHGCEWGDGSWIYCGADGSKASYTKLLDEPAFAVGEPIDVKDVTGVVTWRPAVITAAEESRVQVHYFGWERKWDEWLDISADRIARFRSHTAGAAPAGYMGQEPYGDAFQATGDVIGCYWDLERQTLSFSLNGVDQGVAFHGVCGLLRPAVSVTNPHAVVVLNVGKQPFTFPNTYETAESNASAAASSAAASELALRVSTFRDAANELRRRSEEEHRTAKVTPTETSLVDKRAKSCSCWRRRLAASELCEIVPVPLGFIMRVLKMCGDDKQRAAEWLITHGDEIAAAEDDGVDECSGHTHLTVIRGGGQPDCYLEHCSASFSGFIPPAPGLQVQLEIAEPIDSSRPLENAAAVAGRCVIIDRGGCTFVVKVRNAQAAGAAAVLLVSDSDVSFIPDCGSEDCSDLTIPVVMVGNADGERLKRFVRNGEKVDIEMKEGWEAPPDAVPGPQSATSSASSGDEIENDAPPDAAGLDEYDDDAEGGRFTPPQASVTDASSSVIGGAGGPAGSVGDSGEDAEAATAVDDGGETSQPEMFPRVEGTAPVACVPTTRASLELASSEAWVRAHGFAFGDDPSIAALQPQFALGWRQGGSTSEASGFGEMGHYGPAAVRAGQAAFEGSGSSGQASASSAAVDEWLATIDRRLRERRVPGATRRAIEELLREGGETNLAIARTMLDDVRISLPPRPAPRTPRTHPSPGGRRVAGSAGGSAESRGGGAAPAEATPLAISDVEVVMEVFVNVDAAALRKWLHSAVRSSSGSSGDLSVGTHVQARWSGGGWYDAVIVARHADGTYDVLYGDGDSEVHLDPERIRVSDGLSGGRMPKNFEEDPQVSQLMSVWVPEMLGTEGALGVVQQVDTSDDAVLVRFEDSENLEIAEWWYPSSMLARAGCRAGVVDLASLPAQRGQRVLDVSAEHGSFGAAVRALEVSSDASATASARRALLSLLEFSQDVVAQSASGVAAVGATAAISVRSVTDLAQLLSHEMLQLLGSEFFGVGLNVGSGGASSGVSNDSACSGLPTTLRSVASHVSDLVAARPNAAADLLSSATAMLRSSTFIVDSAMAPASTTGSGVHLYRRPTRDRAADQSAATFDFAERWKDAAQPLPGALVVTFSWPPSELDEGDAYALSSSRSAAPVRVARSARSGRTNQGEEGDLTQARSTEWNHRPLAVRGDTLCVSVRGRPDYRVAVTPVSPNLGVGLWLIEQLLGVLTNDPPHLMPKGASEALSSAFDALVEFCEAPLAPSVLRAPALILLARVARELPEHEWTHARARSLAPLYTELVGLHDQEADSTRALQLHSDVTQGLVELMAAVAVRSQAPVEARVWETILQTPESTGAGDTGAGSGAETRASSPPAGSTLRRSPITAGASGIESKEDGGGDGAQASHVSATGRGDGRQRREEPGWLSSVFDAWRLLSWLSSTWSEHGAPASGPLLGAATSKRSTSSPPRSADTRTHTAAPIDLVQQAWRHRDRTLRALLGAAVEESSAGRAGEARVARVLADGKLGAWNGIADSELAQFASDVFFACHDDRSSFSVASTSVMDASKLQVTSAAFSSYASLQGYSQEQLQLRFCLLALANRLVASALPLVVLPADAGHVAAGGTVGTLVSRMRGLLFRDVKLQWCEAVLENSAVARPNQRPRITVDRFAALHARTAAQTVFGQVAWQLLGTPAEALRAARTTPHLAFEVQLQHERVAGESGPYRESFGDMSRELMGIAGNAAGSHAQAAEQGEPGTEEGDAGLSTPPSLRASRGAAGAGASSSPPSNAAGDSDEGDGESAAASALRLFVACANRAAKGNENRDKMVPAAGASSPEDLDLFHALGRVIGVAMRTKVRMPLALPSQFWRPLVGEVVSLRDVAHVDDYFVNHILAPLRSVKSAEEFEEVFGDTLTPSTVLSDFTVVEAAGGSGRPSNGAEALRFEDRLEAASWLESIRVNEVALQVAAVRCGIAEVVPTAVLSLFTPLELEQLVCGRPDVDVDMLQRHTEYAAGLDEHAPHIRHFWSVLRGFSQGNRLRFVKFAWAQERLPTTDRDYVTGNVRLLLKPWPLSGDPDGALPLADTCWFNVALPPYSSRDVMQRQLLRAIHHAGGLDADAV